jgi:molybdopterin-guanine dinucleotide biosynthesis protein A
MNRPAGVILAGGRSSRMLDPMGTVSKALVTLAGRPMIAHVIENLQGQVEPLLLSTGENTGEFDALGFAVVPDVVLRHRGPLTGLCSAFQYLQQRDGPEWLLLVPCDAPLLPENLAARLLQAAQAQDKPVAVVRSGARLQPTFSLWHRSVADKVCAAVMQTGQPGLRHLVGDLPHVVVDWEETRPPAFFNVNTRDDLAIAERWLDPSTGDGT